MGMSVTPHMITCVTRRDLQSIVHLTLIQLPLDLRMQPLRTDDGRPWERGLVFRNEQMVEEVRCDDVSRG